MPPAPGSGARLALLLQRVVAAGRQTNASRAPGSAALGVSARGAGAGGESAGLSSSSSPSSSSSSSSSRQQPPNAPDATWDHTSAPITTGLSAASWPLPRPAEHQQNNAAAAAADACDWRPRRRPQPLASRGACWAGAAAAGSSPPPIHRAFSAAAAAVVKEAPEASGASSSSSAPIERPSRGRRGPDFGPAATGRAAEDAAAAAAAASSPDHHPPAPPPKPAVPEGPPYKWRVSVVTGNVRGAGTHAPVTLQLVGSKGASPSVPVGGSDDGDSGLARATAVALDLALERDIGQLRRVRIERAPSSTSGTGEGWFLDHVEVEGPAGEHLLLPCRAWFGASDCGDFVGALERNLIPVEEGEGLYPHLHGGGGGSAHPGGGAEGRGARWSEVVGSAPVEVRAAGVAFPHPEKVIKNQVRGVVARGFGYGGEDAFFFGTGGAARASAAWAPRQRRSAAAPPDPRCTSASAIVGGGGGGIGGGGSGEGDGSAPSVLPDPLPPPDPRPAFADPSSHHYDPDQVHGEEPQFEIPQLSAGAGPSPAPLAGGGGGAGASNDGAASSSSSSKSAGAPAAAPPASAGAGPAAVFGMGVSDGVYMWKEVGIDSGAMSRTLMETAAHMVQAGCEDVLRVLQVAARHVESEGVAGSATACLVTVNKAAARLQAATLGDSGFFVLSPAPGREEDKGGAAAKAAAAAASSSSAGRPSLGQSYRPPLIGSSRASFPQQQEQQQREEREKAAAAVPASARLRVRYRSPQLEREFGCPYQLGHHSGAQAPEDADLVAMPVGPGDVIVMGTDGLLDNLSEAEILREVQLEAAAAAAAKAGRGGREAARRRQQQHAAAASAAAAGAAASAAHLPGHHHGVHHHPTHHHEVGGVARPSAAAPHLAASAPPQPAAPPAPPPSSLISPSSLAHRLARLAFEASVDRSRSTPYSRAATEAFDMVYAGGKPDDITVVVAVVGGAPPPPAAA